MTTPLRLDTTNRDDGTHVLLARGELDLSNIADFTRALADLLEASAGNGKVVTVDLSKVEYLDSAAINALFAHVDRIQLVANPILMPVLTVSGLTSVVAVEPGPPPAAH
jgi:anti-anti-sigma factor